MNLKRQTAFLLIFLFAIAACKKGITIVNPQKSVSPPVLTTGPGVYVVGSVIAGNGNVVATCWKNGVAIKLGDSTYGSTASSILINGSDIYIGGYSGKPGYGSSVATYWKNGVVNRVSDGTLSQFQSSLALSGSDVYTGGFVDGSNSYQMATYWKNGIAVALPYNTLGAVVNGISVSGSDVYATGVLVNSGIPPSAAYWKNGVLTKLTDSSASAEANAISINDGDIYIAGHIASARFYNTPNGPIVGNPVASYWKNGLATKLADSTTYSKAYAIISNGSDIYVGGYIIAGPVNSPAYWKNGVITKLNGSALGSTSGIITAALTLDGTDVYFAGGYAGYWKNGVAVSFEKYSAAYAILVVPN